MKKCRNANSYFAGNDTKKQLLNEKLSFIRLFAESTFYSILIDDPKIISF